MSIKPSKKRHPLSGFKHAFNGIGYAVRTQRHMRFHVAMALAVIFLGIYFNVSSRDWTLLILCIALVLAAELINTAIEHVTDLASPEWNQLAKAAKDTAAGAVLILSIFASIAGIIVFYPYLITFL